MYFCSFQNMQNFTDRNNTQHLTVLNGLPINEPRYPTMPWDLSSIGYTLSASARSWIFK